MIVFSDSEFRYLCDIVDFYSDILGSLGDINKLELLSTLKTKLDKAKKLECKTLISNYEKLRL